MAEKPKVLVVYGYHPEESYAFDLGLRLVKEPYRNFVITKYTAKHDERRSELDQNYERNLHYFIRSFGTPYAIVLHNSEEDSSREKAWRLWMRRKHPHAIIRRLKYPMVEVFYETRRKLPGRISQEIQRLGSKYFPNEFKLTVDDEFARWPDSMPEGIDELSVEFYVRKRPAKAKSVGFVKDLAELLKHPSDE